MSELKVALVTGGSRGIGKACVLALAEEESIGTVVFTSRNAAKGDQIQDELQKEVGDKAKIYHRELNLDSPALTESGMDKLLQDFPRIDILVNNAGVFQDWGVSAFEASTETVLNTFHVNTLAPLVVLQKVLPKMKENKYGRVINMSSILGQISAMNGKHVAYRMSKASLNVLTKAFHDELKAGSFNILINSQCPGFCATDLTRGQGRPPAMAAETTVWLATLPDGGPSGKFFTDKKEMDF